MTPKEEKRITFMRMARYFFTVLFIYMGVYFILYLILSFIHALYYLNPLIRVIILILFFVLDIMITSRLMRNETVKKFIEIR